MLIKKYFIFVYCWTSLVGYSARNKDIKVSNLYEWMYRFPAKVVSPTKHLYNKRQVRNIYDTFIFAIVFQNTYAPTYNREAVKELRTNSHIGTRYASKYYAYREFLGLFLPLERSDGMNDRQLSYKNKIGLSNLFWGLGFDRLVFSLLSKISFPLTGLLNLK